MARELQRYQLIERSITKKYRKEIWNPFIEGVKNYRLVSEGDRIAVCISGSSGSMLMAKLLAQLQRISQTHFELEYIYIQLDNNEEQRRKTEENAELLNIPLRVFETKGSKESLNACLAELADELSCNLLAAEECLSDVVEGALADILYQSKLEAMLPREQISESLALIRPMYCVNREAVVSWVKYNGLDFDGTNADENQQISESGRLIADMKKVNSGIERNIFKSLHAVCLDTLPGFFKDGEQHSFLERFNAYSGNNNTE